MTEVGIEHTDHWTAALALPEVTELRRRRRRVTASLGLLTVALFSLFIVGFAGFPDTLGSTDIAGIPLSLWLALSEFVGVWILVYAYFRLSRTYIQPAADAAITAVLMHTEVIR